MRENRLYGSEGGAGVLSLRSYPYLWLRLRHALLSRGYINHGIDVHRTFVRRGEIRARTAAPSW